MLYSLSVFVVYYLDCLNFYEIGLELRTILEYLYDLNIKAAVFS